MQHPWDNSTIFYQQVKESGIIPTFDGFCFPQKEKRETRLFKKIGGRGLAKRPLLAFNKRETRFGFVQF